MYSKYTNYPKHVQYSTQISLNMYITLHKLHWTCTVQYTIYLEHVQYTTQTIPEHVQYSTVQYSTQRTWNMYISLHKPALNMYSIVQ